MTSAIMETQRPGTASTAPVMVNTWMRGADVAKSTCSMVDCDLPSFVRGWCSKHYFRWRRHGSPDAVADRSGRSIIRGYVVLSMHRGHPLASVSGSLPEHRKVLYEAIGPGEHACHWCARLVTWDSHALDDRSTLTVDHLDRVKTNNTPDNLVPSCLPCNTARGANDYWEDVHSGRRAKRRKPQRAA